MDKAEATGNQIIIQSNNYNVTVIPVDYPVRRIHINQNQELVVMDQYRNRDHDEDSSQGALYSVSQRVPPVNTSYSSLCANTSSDAGYVTEQYQDWDREQTVSTSDTNKDISSDALSEKHGKS